MVQYNSVPAEHLDQRHICKRRFSPQHDARAHIQECGPVDCARFPFQGTLQAAASSRRLQYFQHGELKYAVWQRNHCRLKHIWKDSHREPNAAAAARCQFVILNLEAYFRQRGVWFLMNEQVQTSLDKMIFRKTNTQLGRRISVTPHNSTNKHLAYGRIILNANTPQAVFSTDDRETGLICLSG